MRKASAEKDTLKPEYKRSDFPRGFVRGKYAKNATASSNIAVLDADVARAFPDSRAVNDALRAILEIAKHVATQPQQGVVANDERYLQRRSNG